MNLKNSVGLTPSFNGISRASDSIASKKIASNTPPPRYMPDMATAFVSHSGSLGGYGGGGTADTTKKKRGRPRKYAPDGTVAITIRPAPTPSFNPMMSSPLQKRGRGRPPGSGKKQQLAALGEIVAGSAGAGFTPHAITIAAGEDVAARIMSFSQQGPRGICILSANGAISNVTLRQPSTSGGTVTYEGRFEILALSGSFLVTESGGNRSRTGGLSVSLAGPDGRVIGGSVAGMLMAASPVQVIVGSFMCGGSKAQQKQHKADKPGIHKMDGDPIPDLSMNDMADMKPDSSPLNQSADSSNADSPQGQMIAVQSMGWGMPHETRRNLDIDISSSGQ